MALRVIADHSRSVAFLIGDGVILPMKDGAMFFVKLLVERSALRSKTWTRRRIFFIKQYVSSLKKMSSAYPFLKNFDFILEVTEAEERFRITLDKGLLILEEAFANIEGNNLLDGDTVFQLHIDTFGFPLDLTRLIASEKGFIVDETGYQKRTVNEQKEAGRKNWKGAEQLQTSTDGNILEGSLELILKATPRRKRGSQIVALLDENKQPVNELQGKRSYDVIKLHFTLNLRTGWRQRFFIW